jgi:hypothetical protein
MATQWRSKCSVPMCWRRCAPSHFCSCCNPCYSAPVSLCFRFYVAKLLLSVHNTIKQVDLQWSGSFFAYCRLPLLLSLFPSLVYEQQRKHLSRPIIFLFQGLPFGGMMFKRLHGSASLLSLESLLPAPYQQHRISRQRPVQGVDGPSPSSPFPCYRLCDRPYASEALSLFVSRRLRCCQHRFGSQARIPFF